MTVGTAFFAAIAGTGATWNPADKSANISLDATKTIATKINTNASELVRATLSRNAATDQGYFEIYIANGDTSPFITVGLAPSTTPTNSFPGSDAGSYSYYEQSGQKYNNNVPVAFGAAYLSGDIVGVAMSAGKLWFAKNNVWQASGNPVAGTNPAFTGISGLLFPCCSLYRKDAGPSQVGLRMNTSLFTYAPPSGFGAWDR